MSTLDPNAVRVVFFGPPRSGKTTLLYAAARHAERGAEDDTITLSAADPNVVRRELVPLRLLVDLPGPRAVSGAVEFIDCDGKAVSGLLSDADQLRRKTARSALADAVRKADALVLVVDAEGSVAEVEETFRGFHQFLGVLESTRTADRDVGGLPVYLTLTKCDALYRPAGDPTDWLTRIEARKREVRERFHDWFDAGGSADPFLTFGSTDVRVAATATQVPRVIGAVAYADDTGGFGVTDFLTDVLTAARGHRDRAVRSGRRLRWTAGLAVGLLAVMLVTLLGLTAARPPGPVEALTARVERMKRAEGPPAVRLAEANFDRNRSAVAAVRESPVFEQLPPELQAFVRDRDREFAAYDEYRRRFLPPQFSPADVRTASDLTRLEQDLAGPLAPPAEYRLAWGDTEAVTLLAKWRADVKLLQAAEDQVHDWYRGQISKASELLLASVPAEKAPAAWRADVTAFLAQSSPYRDDEPVPGSVALPVRRGGALTYATAAGFERAANARRDWQLAAVKLSDLRDLADALGLTADPTYTPSPGEPAAVLDLPLPTNGGSEALQAATARLAALKKRFPAAADGIANWSVANVPGPLRDELGRRLRLAAANGADQVRRLILGDPAVNRASPAWPALAAPDGLLNKPEMKDWGRLLRRLLRWADPSRPDVDPVADLAAFVSKERFDWPLAGLDVTLPNALKVRLLKPAGDLTVTITDPTGRPRVYPFEPTGTPQTGSDAVVHRFRLRAGAGPLVYVPGDGFSAELPLADGDTSYRLRWIDARTAAYQFDKLTREPTVEAVGPGAVPQRAAGVRVTADPPAAGFAVTELLPEVK